MPARGRHRRQRASRITRISLMLTAGGAGVALPLIAAGGATAAQPETAAQSVSASPVTQRAATSAAQQDSPAAGVSTESHTVADGDTLFTIATLHEVAGGWEGLYEGNREVVGEDPDLIFPGQELALDEATASPSAAKAPAKNQAGERAEAPAPPVEEAPVEATPAPPVAEAPSEAPITGFQAPVSAAPSTAYGVAGGMWSSGYHTGVDFSVGSGTSVVAVNSGEVVSAGWGGSYGNEVVIRHADGHYSQYAHLSSLSVTTGQQVGAGEQIGLSGSTGNSTGPHLHFEVRTGPGYGSDIDPLAYLRGNGVTV